MNGKDFRIGNIINYGGEPVEVIKVFSDKKIEVFSDTFQFWDVDLGDEEELKAKPEPLSEEWLLKFEFLKESNILGDTYWHSGCGFNHVIGSRWSIRNTFNSYVLWVESVHELQNLFFALNKEELIINP